MRKHRTDRINNIKFSNFKLQIQNYKFQINYKLQCSKLQTGFPLSRE
jgi:hypothetical protein